MALQIYEWHSYSCNNSSDHRLVAEFDSEEKAQAMGEELRALFQANAEQCDTAIQEGGDWDPYDFDPSPALVAFAEKYGGEFTEGLVWGDGDMFVDDMPEVTVVGRVVYAYHGYMSGGFEGDLPELIEKAGARSAACNPGPAWLHFEARAGADRIVELQQALDEFLGQRKTTDNFSDWKVPWNRPSGNPDRLPSGSKVERVSVNHDDDGTTFTLAVGANAVPWVLGWLESKGASKVSVKLVSDEELAALVDAGA